MIQGQSRVTVVGTRRRVDVAVPTLAPIGEYSGRLARLCGDDRDPIRPAAWSLALPGDEPFPLGGNLAQLGVLDGQVLYLRDVATEPGAPPVVEDLDELVADQTNAHRRAMPPGGQAVLVGGLAWLTAIAVGLGWRMPGQASVLVLALAALALLATAWVLSQRGGMTPAPVRRAVAFTAVPCLAVAGGIIGQSAGGPGWRWMGCLIGANVATVMAIAVLPDPFLVAAELNLVAACVVGLLLAGLAAERTEGAAVVAAASVGLFALARYLAAALSAWSHRAVRTPAGAAALAGQFVDRTARLLAVVLAGPALALTVALPALALSGNGFGVALAAILCACLLVRARLAGFTAELVVYLGTGLVGLFSILLGGARLLHVSVAVQALGLTGAGAVVVGVGVAASVFGPPVPEEGQSGGVVPRPRKRSRAEVIGVVSAIAVAPLAMGVFGVLGHLVRVGRHLF